MTGLPERSLFRRLMLGFFGVVLVIWLANLAWDIHETRTTKQRDMQRELRASALRILVLMQTVDSRPPEEIAPLVRKMEALHYALYRELGWYVPALQTQVWRRGQLVYASGDAGPITATVAGIAPQRPPLPDGWVVAEESDPATGVTVRMATQVIGEWLLQTSSIGYYLAPLLFSLPFLLLPAWYIVRVGLGPLRGIVAEIEERSANALTPLAPSPFRELSPLVASVNRLMRRLVERLEREQEFLADAAHELKTPLSIIQINADALAHAHTPQRIQEAGEGLRQGVRRATHTVHQLLALARSGPDSDAAPRQALDLVQLVCDRLALAGPLAAARQIELELQAPDLCAMYLHRESMAALIDNVVGNAIKYSPDGGRVAVSITADAGLIMLAVRDEGPGIAPAAQRKVFERFYRLPDQDQPGSGLGLAIAERAAQRNLGGITLGNCEDGPGLCVQVTFDVTLAAG
ncbi:sensor histidine kinase [Rugamonas apoptosis]|uniref:histidine kinase n=1 Tax=Rugamonas apoptosis TaxID=2758570 RepID=A0A7W2F9R9_9BURK|nr:ATP-binding protein [Rugamonas apoptosis]MBA5687609.1 two-component sensor histidine kinase [Rugamonas apoptosis]